MKKIGLICRMLTLILPVFMMLSLSIGASEASVGETAPIISVGAREIEDGGIEVILRIEEGQGIAALLAGLSYDGEKLLFLGGGSSVMSLTYEDVGDQVRFILDLHENTPSKCELATFYFQRIGEGDCALSLSFGEGDSCLYFNSEWKLSPLSPTLPEPCTVRDTAQAKEETEQPRLLSLSLERRDGAVAEIGFEVSVENGHFAAGIKLFAVDLESGESREYYIFGITDKGGRIACTYEIELYKKTAVVITAAGYERSGMICGEKRIELMP